MTKGSQKVLEILDGASVMLSYNSNLLKVLKKKGILNDQVSNEISKILKEEFNFEALLNENISHKILLEQIKKAIEQDPVTKAALNDNKYISKI